MTTAVETPATEEQALREQLEQALADRDDYLGTLQRVQAEYDNYRRRAQREQAEQHDRGGQALAHRLLPVLDAFDGALQHSAEAVGPLRSALLGALEAEGLERLEPTGSTFDPAEQHAVEQLPAEVDAADGPAGDPTVESVLRPGYRWRGRLLRPAMVRVRG